MISKKHFTMKNNVLNDWGVVSPLRILALVVILNSGWIGNLTADLIILGYTEPYSDVTLAAPITGIVGSRPHKEGDSVKKGTIVLELKKNIQQMDVERLDLIRSTREKEYNKTLKLFETTQSLSLEEVELKELNLKVSEMDLKIAKEQVALREIKAPFDGTIAQIELEVGEAALAQNPLVRIVDTRKCYFVSNVEAETASLIQVNQAVDVQFPTRGQPLILKGIVNFISPVADPASGLLKIKVIFDNAAGKIHPGVSATIELKD
jgi:RND family efflux transporter MFP subunit